MPSPRTRHTPSQQAIVRAVASSTAIETGERIVDIESRLRHPHAHLPHLSLARPMPSVPKPR